MSLRNALTGAEINCLASRILADTSVHWLGVFARDQVPRLDRSQRRPFALIINTCTDDKPGAHWLAFYASADPKGAPLEMFDSYLMSPNIHAFANLSPRIYSPSVSYQSIDTLVCGHTAYSFYFTELTAIVTHQLSKFYALTCIAYRPSPRLTLSSLALLIRSSGRTS